MTIEFFVFKTLRFLTLIVCLIFLFLKYFQLPDLVAVFFNKSNSSEGFLPKDQFFYLISFILFIVNLFVPILFILLKKLPDLFFDKINNTFKKNLSKNDYLSIAENWINLIITSLNILLLLSILIIARLNATEYSDKVSDYSWFVKLIFSALIIMFAYPFLKLFTFTNKVEIDE